MEQPMENYLEGMEPPMEARLKRPNPVCFKHPVYYQCLVQSPHYPSISYINCGQAVRPLV